MSMLSKNYKTILFLLIIMTSSQLLIAKSFTLKWLKEKRSVQYVIEVSKDKAFTKISQILNSPSNSKVIDLPIGIYFIRVYGLDKAGRKSKYTPVRQITVRYKNYERIFKRDNKVFVPKYLSLDFLAKKKPDAKLYYKIKKKFILYTTNDMIYMGKSGKKTLRYYFKDKNGAKSEKKSITFWVDKKAPDHDVLVDKVSYSDKKVINVRVRGEISIVAGDDDSGVREILYSFDKQVFYFYDSPIPITDSTSFTLYFKIIDNVGNVTRLYKKKVQPVH
ncbi:MAG: hypothetical protein IEMM0008_1791 [bacterium]|nr:MAG: hypothetical protein IEMM0008_1791 [bacterium]